MRGVYSKENYTVLVIPKGMGQPKTFNLIWDYKKFIVYIAIFLGTISSLIGVMFYRQSELVKQYESLVIQKEAQISQLKKHKIVLENEIGEVRGSLEELKSLQKQLPKGKIIDLAPIAVATPPKIQEKQNEKEKESVVIKEEQSDQYEPTFKPCEGEITSYFGNRTNPFTQQSQQVHKGIDIANSKGTPIYAAASGVIEEASYLSGYGYAIYINHGNGIQTRYGHNSKLLVKVGDEVEKGQLIAKMGSTGNSTGNHLHFEILNNGKQVNPEKLFE